MSIARRAAGPCWKRARATSEATRSSERDRKSTRLNSSHTVIYTLSLHDALPILSYSAEKSLDVDRSPCRRTLLEESARDFRSDSFERKRSEEHTSELQSHSDLHSFPTRRSSDLELQRREKPRCRSLAVPPDLVGRERARLPKRLVRAKAPAERPAPRAPARAPPAFRHRARDRSRRAPGKAAATPSAPLPRARRARCGPKQKRPRAAPAGRGADRVGAKRERAASRRPARGPACCRRRGAGDARLPAAAIRSKPSARASPRPPAPGRFHRKDLPRAGARARRAVCRRRAAAPREMPDSAIPRAGENTRTAPTCGRRPPSLDARYRRRFR